MCVCASCVSLYLQKAEEGLELELGTVVSYHVVVIKPEASERANSAFSR